MNTYFDFAENDYLWFEHAYADGFVANGMAAQAQEICEKYIKHIITLCETTIQNGVEQAEYESTMHSHNLVRLMRYMENNAGQTFTAETKRLLQSINGYYFTARYPGDESIEVTAEDIDLCYEAVEHCRSEVLAMKDNGRNKSSQV